MNIKRGLGSVGFRGGRHRGLRSVLLLLLTMLVLAAWSGVALADQWTDISDATWQDVYHVTAQEAATVADGYPDGTFRPDDPVTRGQFAKMVSDGLSIPTENPATPTFSDVPADYLFYPYIEGDAVAGIISGYPDGTFRPENVILRQQANSILGLWLSDEEIAQTGVITGGEGTYPSLAAWYEAEGEAYLSQFADADDVFVVHRAPTAYLVMCGVVLGSSSGGEMFLNPGSDLSRAQAVAMILRTEAAGDFGGPAVTSVDPDSGPVAGGTTVTVEGSGFVGVTEVLFGSTPATFTVTDPFSLTVLSPPHAAGTVDVRVKTALSTSAVVPEDEFTFVSPPASVPTITLVSPATGPIAGGQTVTLTGTNLTGTSSVTFGGIAATSVTVVNATTVTCRTPAHAVGAVDVVVTTPSGSATDTNGFTYVAAPTITNLSPNSGTTAGNTLVTITGSSLTGTSSVTFGGTVATSVAVVNATTVTCRTPVHLAGSVTVTLTTPAGVSNALPYTFLPPPTVISVSPTWGLTVGGTSVTVKGTGFVGVSEVKFGATPGTAVIVKSPTELTVTAPAHAAGTVDVQVVTPLGTSPANAADRFTYYVSPPPIPLLDSITPTSGSAAGGKTVTLEGFFLTGASAVRFGTTEVPVISVNAAGTILTAKTPAHTQGQVYVYVITPGGTSNPMQYEFEPPGPIPTVTTVSAYSGSEDTDSPECNVPGGTASGDLMIALVQIRDGSSVSAPTAPAGWIPRGIYTGGSGSSYFGTFVYSRVADGSEPSHYHWSNSGSGNWDDVEISIVTYRTGFTVETVSTWSADGSGATITGNSVTASADDQYLVFVGGGYRSSSTSITQPTGFTSDFGRYSNGFVRRFAHMLQASAGASGDKSATLSNSATFRQGWLFVLSHS